MAGDELNDEEIEAIRNSALQAIVASNSRLRAVVAGPGTGKTYTFSRLIERADGTPLVLTFLNNLVRDMAAAFGDKAEVQTFHGYSRSLLHRLAVPGITSEVDYYPAFAILVEEDLGLLLDVGPSREAIEAAYMNLDHGAGLPRASLDIGDYYNVVSHTDAVYQVFEVLEQRPDVIPALPQLLVDEYQDFSLLEARYIDLLASRSPTVIVGDDDQALFGFRHAAADYLRQRATTGNYERFELPVCSRCTAVLVAATHQVVARGKAAGLFADRLDKQFICYMPKKRAASEQYPRIVHARCSVQNRNAPYLSRYIAEQIREISSNDIDVSAKDGNPTVLIIGPRYLSEAVGRDLITMGMPNVDIRRGQPLEVDPLDGYERLIRNDRSRLGWRILVYSHRPKGWDEAVTTAHRDAIDLVELLDPEFVATHLERTRLLAAVRAGEDMAAEDRDAVEAIARSFGLTVDLLADKLTGVQPTPDDPVAGSPTIVVTTLQGAKGLQAEHVFVVGLNEDHFPRTNTAVTEEEACCLLVALTRAKQQCTLLSCGNYGGQWTKPSVFLDWLGELLEQREINAQYFK